MKEILETKTELYDKIKSIVEFKATWEADPVSKKFKLIVEGIYMNRTKAQSGLTDGDKEWIANLVSSTVKTEIQAAVKPIQEDISEIKDRLDVLEEDMKNVKEDIKAIKECPTIQKELKK